MKTAAKSFVLLVGSYTSNITTLLYQPNAKIPSLTYLGGSPVGANPNPSWLSLHPTNRSILFSTNELEPGFITSYTIDSKGLVHPVDQKASQGTDPAFLLPLEGEVIEPNYTSGTFLSHVLASDGVHFASDGNEIQLVGSGPNPSRQASAHPHEAYAYGSELFVPDLGSDKIWRIGRVSNKTAGQWKINGYIGHPAGSGPRHVQTVGNTLYTIHELANTVTEQKIPTFPGNDTPALLANVSVLPTQVPVGSQYTAAELLISPSKQYLYASNRNIATASSAIDPRGDTIAVLSTSPKLHVVAQVHTGLQQIRGMQISPDGKHIAAAGLVGGGLAVFEVVNGGANLTLSARYTGVGSVEGSSFIWL